MIRAMLRILGNPLLVVFWLLNLGVTAVSAQPFSLSGWSDIVDITERDTPDWQGYPIVMCDPYQNTHIFWADNNYGDAAVDYRTDREGVWSPPNPILLSQPEVFWLSGAVSAANNSLHLAWVNKSANSQLFYGSAPIVEAMDASSWKGPTNLDKGVFNPSVTVDSLGTVHIVYARTDDAQMRYAVLHITSEDDGDTWSDPETIYDTTFPEPAYIRIESAIDGKDRLHVGMTLRSLEYALFSEVGYIHTYEDGTWSAYMKVQDTPTAWQGVEWIAPYAFGDDEIHLTWHDPRRMHMVSNDGGQTWSTPDEIMALGAAFGGPNQLTMDSDGTIYAIVAELNGVYIVPWGGNSWGKPDLVDDTPIDPHYQHVTVCQGNRLHVVFYDRTGPMTTWYSSREVDAHPIPQQLPPPPPKNEVEGPQPIEAANPVENSVESDLQEEPQTTLDFNRTAAQETSSSVQPILIGTLLALSLICLVVLANQIYARFS